MRIVTIKSFRKGFTLIEMMIAVSIIALLAVIAIPAFKRYLYDARRSEAVVMLNNVWKAEKAYFEEHGYFRPSFTGSQVDVGLPNGSTQALMFSPPSSKPRYNLILGSQGAHPSNVYALSKFPSFEYLETSGDTQHSGLNYYGLAKSDDGSGTYNMKRILIGAEGRIGASSDKLDILFMDSANGAQLFVLCDSTNSDPGTESGALGIYQAFTDFTPRCSSVGSNAVAGGGGGGTGNSSGVGAGGAGDNVDGN